MHGIDRLRTFVAAGIGALLLLAPATHPAAAQQAGERRIITTEGADYFGRDYQVVKGADLDRCSAACLGDDRCQAFTLNTRTNWCFLKDGVGELRTVEGAVSGRVVKAAAIDEASVGARETELSFLPQTMVNEAKRLRLQVASEDRDPNLATLSKNQLTSQARTALSYAQAIPAWRELLRRDPLDTGAWQGLADSALAYQPSEYSDQAENRQLRRNASVEAYVTASSDAQRAGALRTLGRALEAEENWKLAIRTYRASLNVAETADTRSLLDAAVAAHGFRVTGNGVDNDTANPRICLTFSDQLASAVTGSENAGDFVQVEDGETLPVTASGNQICVEGVKHGERYHIVVRPGVTSVDGERLSKPVEISVYVRDRDPTVRFATNAYVLPGGGDASIPVTTVNTDEIEARLQRISDRALSRALGEGGFLQQLSDWQRDEVAANTGEDVWTGTVSIARELNKEVTTAIPVSAIAPEMKPGVYILTAKAKNGPQYQDSFATQWFVVSDIGLTSLAAEDGFHVFARSLGGAQPLSGVKLQLVAANNQILGEAMTDSAGHGRLSAGLLRGTGGDRPALLTAYGTGGDFVFLDLTQSPFDLTDRGVNGRPPAGPLDVFLTSERGIYRTGETAYFTGTVRSPSAEAVEGLTLTQIVRRPDGVEHARRAIADEGAGGFAFGVAFPDNAMRGIWKVSLYTDPKLPALAEKTVIVEDFEPEKIDFDLTADAETLDPAEPPAVGVSARYLFGAPAGGLEVSGEAVLQAADGIEGFDGYQFGLSADETTAVQQPFEGATTDEEGKATLSMPAFQPPATTKPIDAELQVRVVDTSGRPVERTVTLPLAGSKSRIGIKPRFEDTVAENSEAAFDLIALDPSNQRRAMKGAAWELDKITTRYQWYSTSGSWNYEPVETTMRVANGTLDIGSDDPAAIARQVDWGEYELTVRDASGEAIPASVRFEAGWYVAALSLDTPDMARVSLDKPRYRIGDTAVVHVEPRFAGKAEILVMDERVIATKTADIPAEGGDVEIPVTRDWGPGAYVTAIVYRPMDLAEKRMPGRAIGLVHASVDPGDRALTVSIDAPAKIEPRRSVDVGLSIGGIANGETAYVTLAAVDEGILNITGFDPPSLSDYYFGQRRLGVEIRDLYSKLIDRMQGAPGTVRSGGDAGGSYESPPPMDNLVSLYSGLVTAGPDGKATVSLDVPDFNGTLKLMALAWTKTGVGEANREMVVRDPVVMQVASPLFLAPGDTSRVAVDLHNVEGPAGPARLTLSGGDGAVTLGREASRSFDLAADGHNRFLVPVTAETIGDAAMTVSLALPDGREVTKSFTLPVRSNAPETVNKSRVALAANGGRLHLDPNLFADFVPGTAAATLSVTGAAEFDVAGVVRALDLYPYGCTEQITSKAMPLVYLEPTVLAAGLGRVEDVRKRVNEAIRAVLANQASNGSFGLWQPDSGDLWLDAYVSDFLTRAREAGYDVPVEGFTLAIDSLRNSLASLPDHPDMGPVAYATYVLARNGRAAIGDLRYYADNQLGDFSPLAKSQLAAALALYGDRVRAERLFREAVETPPAAPALHSSWSDYGSPLRDDAAILTLGLETRIDGVPFDGLVRQVNMGRESQHYTSTQEDAWSLLAAHALLGRNPPKLTVAGKDVNGPYTRAFDAGDLATGIDVANRAASPVGAQLTLRGVPKVAPPASSEGYAIERHTYTLDGQPADPTTIGQGDRLVVVVEVTPVNTGPARLMIDDPLPAGFEIDNPAILKGGDVAALDWLELTGEARHSEFRSDRFLAAVNQGDGETGTWRFAYIVRAVSPGTFVHPAALVQNMYDPSRRGRTAEGHVSIVGPLR